MSLYIENGVHVKRPWTSFKSLLNGVEKKLRLQYEQDSYSYHAYVIDGPVIYSCRVYKAGQEPSSWTQSQIDQNAIDLLELEAYPAPGQIIPTTSKGTPLSNPNVVSPGYLLYSTGAYDLTAHDGAKTVADINGLTPKPGDCYKLSDAGTLTAGSLEVVADDVVQYYWGVWAAATLGKRGAGRSFALKQNGPGLAQTEGRFLEHVYVHGGIVADATNADVYDWIEMEVCFPASVPASQVGTGNCSKVPTGLGFNILIPAPLNDGDWQVDGTTLEIGEINLNLCPVPNSSGAGYWNWDPDVTPSLTPVADVGNPDGVYDLFDADLGAQVRQANRLPLRAGGPVTPQALKGKKLLPHWLLRFRISRTDAVGEVAGSALMQVSRRTTV